jgi:hypothetical protein
MVADIHIHAAQIAGFDQLPVLRGPVRRREATVKCAVRRNRQRTGAGADVLPALQVALSINVGGALVDVSPLSTIGALCVAAVPVGHDSKQLFRQLLLWGFAMTLVGALFCQLLIGLFVR